MNMRVIRTNNPSKELWYVYPTHHVVSFTLIAKHHIEQLRKYFKVQEVPEKGFLNIYPYSYPTVIIHPLLYCTSSNFELYLDKRTRYKALIGVEVADSDRISDVAVNVVNTADCLIVPSIFSKRAYENSGTKIPIEVVPHGLNKVFYRRKRRPTNETLKYLYRLKKKGKLIYCLFFLWHSGYRKGADLVYQVLKEIQKTHKNVLLIVKTYNIWDSYMKYLSQLDSFVISGWLTDDDLVDLYDLCDIYLLFSRGGGFELNGLEALARGEIVLASRGGSWDDYLPPESLVDYKRFTTVLHGNPFHIGKGPELSVEKAINKLHDIINNIDDWKEKYSKYARKVRREYSWDRIGKMLKDIVERYI